MNTRADGEGAVVGRNGATVAPEVKTEAETRRRGRGMEIHVGLESQEVKCSCVKPGEKLKSKARAETYTEAELN